MNRAVCAALLCGLILLGLLIAPGSAMAQQAPTPPGDPYVSRSTLCPPLPPPEGRIVEVSTVEELLSALSSASSGDTVLIADGTYDLGGDYLWLDTPNLTLRSASGDRASVVLDDGYHGSSIISVRASNVTVADLTLREAARNAINVTSWGSNLENTLIYNVHIVDAGDQAIMIESGEEGSYPDDGEVACSHIELTDAGRAHQGSTGECYTGGVVGRKASGWVVRDNVIEGLWCQDYLPEHAVLFWVSSRDTRVERNLLRDNAQGIGLGWLTSGTGRTYPDNPCPDAEGGYVGHYGGVVRNNSVFSSQMTECGICLWNACGAQVLHNTVAATRVPFSSIEWRFPNTEVDIINNLTTHSLRDRGGIARLSGNLEDQPLSLFVDGPKGDLHLRPTADAAIDQGVSVDPGLCDDDVDGDVRPIGASRDVGADEWSLLDFDGDGWWNEEDNCSSVPNSDQQDVNFDEIGDACQCGDVNGDGVLNSTDALLIARGWVIDPEDLARCDVSGDAEHACNTTDALIIVRGQAPSTPEGQTCPAYTGE